MEYGFAYNNRGNLASLSFADDALSAEIAQSYDNLGRMLSRELELSISGISSAYYNRVEYGYTNTAQGESSQVNMFVSKAGTHASFATTTYNYTYDDNGNITQITDASGETLYKYYYDTLDRLIREDNAPLGKSYSWTYDFTGNITSKSTYSFTNGVRGNLLSTDSYGYANLWADRLTSYNGVTISYDNIGNPTQLVLESGMPPVILSWEGRELKSYTDEANGNYYSYTYNADGIRTSKYVNGATHEYYLDGSRIMGEYVSTGYLYMYMYDENGSPIGIKLRRTNYAENTYDYFFFEKNLQGDIVAIYNSQGTKIGTYTYDAWGNVTVTTHTSGIEATIARNNPFRYRGYYYDTETGWYYLQTRYYNPTWGRFINTDSVSVLGATPDQLTDKNLYAYCDNNPITRKDDGGMFWDTVFDVVSLCFSAAEVIATPTNPMSWVSLAGDVVDLIPFVTGVGETAKAVGATIKITNAVDNTTDTIKVLKAVDFTGEAVDKMRDLDRAGNAVKSTRSAGQIIHKGYKTNIEIPTIKKPKEYNLGMANRVDFFDGNSIFELKPMNPKGLRDGVKQLQRYNRASGGNFDLILELYG